MDDRMEPQHDRSGGVCEFVHCDRHQERQTEGDRGIDQGKRRPAPHRHLNLADRTIGDLVGISNR